MAGEFVDAAPPAEFVDGPPPKATGLDSQIADAAARNGVDARVFRSLIRQESGFNPRAVSSAGAQGLGQLMPGTAREVGVTDPFDAGQNLNGSAKYLGSMVRRYHGDYQRALAAYNAGPGNVDKMGVGALRVPGADPGYVSKILGALNRPLAGTAEAAEAPQFVDAPPPQFVDAPPPGAKPSRSAPSNPIPKPDRVKAAAAIAPPPPKAPAPSPPPATAAGVAPFVDAPPPPPVKKRPGESPFAALDALKNAAGSPVGLAAREGVGKFLDLLGRPGVATEALLSGDGNAADFARAGHAFMHGVQPAEQQANRDKIKSGLHIKDAIDRLPSGLPRGLADAAVDTALDPTTYLGGLGLIEKGANTLGKATLYGGIKGANAAQNIAAKALTSKPVMKAARVAYGVHDAPDPTDIERALAAGGKLGGSVFDALTPKGKAVRAAIQSAKFDPKNPFASISQPFHDVNDAATMKAQATNTHQGIMSAGQKMHADAIAGLTPDEERDLYHAIDKGTVAQLAPEMQTRANAIKTSLQAILHLLGSGTVKKDLAAKGFQLPEEFKPYDTRTRGIFSRANVKQDYLPHGQRFAGQDVRDIKDESTPGIAAEDLLGPAKTIKDKASSILGVKDTSKLARDDASQLQDVVRQREIIKARYASAGRAIAANDAAEALAKRFGTELPILKTVRGEKPDTGAVYRAATSGLAPEEVRVVNMLQQGAKPEQVALRVYGDAKAHIPQHLVDRAQTVKDAINPSMRDMTTVDTGRKRMDFAGVPDYLKRSFQRDARDTSNVATGGNAIRKLTNASNYGMFFNPLRHMANISTLGALADPKATALAAGRFALAHPESAGAVGGAFVGGDETGDWKGVLAGAALGAAGGHGLRRLGLQERAMGSQERAIEAARKAGAVAVNPEAKVPAFIRALGFKVSNKVPVIGGKNVGLNQLYAASNRTLWGYDEAVKAARYDSLLKQGVAPGQAAQRVGEDLLDYGSKSALTKNLGYVAPFATYRSKMPGAVVRAIARHPERVQIPNRVAPALVGQDQNGGPGTYGEKIRDFLPLAETIRGAAKPEEYLRATLSYPVKDALAAAGFVGDFGFMERRGETTDKGNPKRPDPHWLLGWNQQKHRYNTVADVLPLQVFGGIPTVDQLFSLLHQNPYAPHDFLTDQVEGSTALRSMQPR